MARLASDRDGSGLAHSAFHEESQMPVTLGAIVIITLGVLLIGTLPMYPYSRNWGYAPSGLLVVVLAIVLFMLLL
jgi:Protein of unknown function (DUF3309)